MLPDRLCLTSLCHRDSAPASHEDGGLDSSGVPLSRCVLGKHACVAVLYGEKQTDAIGFPEDSLSRSVRPQEARRRDPIVWTID